jgi:hypothetical protein
MKDIDSFEADWTKDSDAIAPGILWADCVEFRLRSGSVL